MLQNRWGQMLIHLRPHCPPCRSLTHPRVTNPVGAITFLQSAPLWTIQRKRTNMDPAPSLFIRLLRSKVCTVVTITHEVEILPVATSVSGQWGHTSVCTLNPQSTEHHLAKIYSAQHAFTVSSGMAALDVITRLLKPGDEVIAGDDLYGGTNRLLTYLKEHNGVTIHHVDTTDADLIVPLVKAGKTAMVLLESPTNPLLKIADLELIANYVHRNAPDALVVVDNTMMSPYLQRPLEIGADIVYDSGTKYLSGHHDLMAGVVTCNRNDIGQVSRVLKFPRILLTFPTANRLYHQCSWQCSISL